MATSLLIFCLCMFKTNSKDSSFQLFKHFQADIKPWLITYLCILIICLYNSKVERHLCLMCVCDLVWSDLATSESLAHHSVTSRKTWIHSPSYPTLQNTPKLFFLEVHMQRNRMQIHRKGGEWCGHQAPLLKTCTVNSVWQAYSFSTKFINTNTKSAEHN